MRPTFLGNETAHHRLVSAVTATRLRKRTHIRAPARGLPLRLPEQQPGVAACPQLLLIQSAVGVVGVC
jgi:hypothetical protein